MGACGPCVAWLPSARCTGPCAQTNDRTITQCQWSGRAVAAAKYHVLIFRGTLRVVWLLCTYTGTRSDQPDYDGARHVYPRRDERRDPRRRQGRGRVRDTRCDLRGRAPSSAGPHLLPRTGLRNCRSVAACCRRGSSASPRTTIHAERLRDTALRLSHASRQQR